MKTLKTDDLLGVRYEVGLAVRPAVSNEVIGAVRLAVFGEVWDAINNKIYENAKSK